MKLGFYILGKKGYESLVAVVQRYGSDVVEYVVTSQDKGVVKDWHDEIVAFCQDAGVFVCSRKDLCARDADYVFAIGWRWMINKCENLIVFHDSLLPKYRGFAPLVNMLINGEPEIGVTALQAAKEYDKGNIIFQKSIQVEYPIKIQDAIEEIIPLYVDLVIKVCEVIKSGSAFKYSIQNECDATYSLWRGERDYYIDWNGNAQKIKRFVDAVGQPYDFAKSLIDKSEVRVIDVSVVDDVTVEDRDAHIGKVIFMKKGCPVIVCGKGLIMINDLHDLDGNDLIGKMSFRTRFESVL